MFVVLRSREDVDSQRVLKRPLGATLPPVAARHLQVIDGFDDVRGQYIQLSFHVVHERRCNCEHGFIAIHLDYLGLAPGSWWSRRPATTPV